MSLRRALAVLLTAPLLAAGCGGSSTPSDGHRAAEPAGSPPLSAPPTGTVVKVGAAPQGIAYDPLTRSVVVAVREPYRVLDLDPTTLAQRHSFAMPGKTRHLQVAPTGGVVPVGVETANLLKIIDLRTDRVTSVKVQRHPHDAGGGRAGEFVVGNEFSGSASVVRGGKVVRTFSDLRQPGGVVVDGRTLAAVDVRDYTVTTYDLDRLRRTARVAAGRGPTHGVVAAPGRLAVTDTRGNRVLLYTLRPLKQIGAIDLPGSPYGIAGDPTSGTVWVTLTGKNRLVGLDVTGTTPRVIATYPTVRQPDTVAVEPGAHTLWVTGTADGVVQRITR